MQLFVMVFVTMQLFVMHVEPIKPHDFLEILKRMLQDFNKILEIELCYAVNQNNNSYGNQYWCTIIKKIFSSVKNYFSRISR